MAKVKKIIREAGPKISKKELSKISKAAGSTSAALNRIASVQQSMKQADKVAPSIGSAAANMLIKQAQSTPAGVYQLGNSKIAQTIRSMAGTPAGPRNPQSGAPQYAAQPGTGLMIGGTVIKPGGGISVYRQPKGAAPAIGDTAADTTAAAGDGTATAAGDGTMAGDQYDFQSMLDALTAMQQPQFDMGALTDMFNTQYEELSSQFDQMTPLQLQQLGITTNPNAIRARQRMRKTRQDYRRGLPAMALGQSLANLASMGIGGGVTL